MRWSKLLHDPLGFLWAALTTRGVRLVLYVLITAALFPSSRFILAVILLVALGVTWIRDYRLFHKKNIYYLVAAVVFLVLGYAWATLDVKRVDEERYLRSPWGDNISLVKDGTYTGEGQGFRGLIKVEVTVKNHRIVALKTLEFPDAISVLDNEVSAFKREILSKGKLEKPAQPGMYRGVTETLTGYVNAVESALIKGVPDYPQYNIFSTLFLNALIGTAPTVVTLNGLAILFAVFIIFEYALQSMLIPGTGRTINCYNCATCVGACPVKEAEGVQIPMGLVLLTRLGDYERVVELSKYCVGCGRCAAKCPIGNSGPLVISAAYLAARSKKREKSSEEAQESA